MGQSGYLVSSVLALRVLPLEPCPHATPPCAASERSSSKHRRRRNTSLKNEGETVANPVGGDLRGRSEEGRSPRASSRKRPTKKLWERLSPTGSYVLDSPLPTSRIPSRYLRPVFPRRSSFRDGRPEPPADVRSASTAASAELSISSSSVAPYTLVSLVAPMRAAYGLALRPLQAVLRTQAQQATRMRPSRAHGTSGFGEVTFRRGHVHPKRRCPYRHTLNTRSGVARHRPAAPTRRACRGPHPAYRT